MFVCVFVLSVLRKVIVGDMGFLRQAHKRKHISRRFGNCPAHKIKNFVMVMETLSAHLQFNFSGMYVCCCKCALCVPSVTSVLRMCVCFVFVCARVYVELYYLGRKSGCFGLQ